jgi:hypothetical protein
MATPDEIIKEINQSIKHPEGKRGFTEAEMDHYMTFALKINDLIKDQEEPDRSLILWISLIMEALKVDYSNIDYFVRMFDDRSKDIFNLLSLRASLGK